MVNREDNRAQTLELYQTNVSNLMEISPDVFLLSFKKKYDFLPGQVVKIGVGLDHPPRIYSICSGDFEENIRILFNIKEDGFLTPKLASLNHGDKLFASKPYGSFVDGKEPAWWIATGTGIAPFYSMFQSGLWENKTLIHGAKFINQFYFSDDLDWAMGDNYVRCCSREKMSGVFYGRVPDYLKSLGKIPKDIKYYLCGKSLMVVETRDFLISAGVPYENIMAEIYF